MAFGQGGLACCDSRGRKESDTTKRLNWTELNWTDGNFPIIFPLCTYSAAYLANDRTRLTPITLSGLRILLFNEKIPFVQTDNCSALPHYFKIITNRLCFTIQYIKKKKKVQSPRHCVKQWGIALAKTDTNRTSWWSSGWFCSSYALAWVQSLV